MGWGVIEEWWTDRTWDWFIISFWVVHVFLSSCGYNVNNNRSPTQLFVGVYTSVLCSRPWDLSRKMEALVRFASNLSLWFHVLTSCRRKESTISLVSSSSKVLSCPPRESTKECVAPRKNSPVSKSKSLVTKPRKSQPSIPKICIKMMVKLRGKNNCVVSCEKSICTKMAAYRERACHFSFTAMIYGTPHAWLSCILESLGGDGEGYCSIGKATSDCCKVCIEQGLGSILIRSDDRVSFLVCHSGLRFVTKLDFLRRFAVVRWSR